MTTWCCDEWRAFCNDDAATAAHVHAVYWAVHDAAHSRWPFDDAALIATTGVTRAEAVAAIDEAHERGWIEMTANGKWRGRLQEP
jgi:hypothetical protein